MALNLKSLLRSEPIGRVQTSLGEYCLFHVPGHATSEPAKAIGRPLAECDPSEFVRHLARFLLYPVNTLRDGKFKPEGPVLSSADVESLTSADLEEIATAVVEKEDYLSKKLISHSGRDAAGTIVVSHEYGDVEHPRLDGESSVCYLHRLLVEQEKADQQRARDLLSSISGIGNFSTSLSSRIAGSLSAGNTLARHLDALRRTPATSVDELIPRVNIAASMREQQEAYRRPFRDLADRIKELTDVTVESSKFLVESNRIQTSIAGEIKGSGDEAAMAVRKNTRMTWAIIGLTIVGLLLPAYLAYRAERADVEQQRRLNAYAEALTHNLSAINANLDAQNKSLQSENAQLRSITKALEQRIVELKTKPSARADSGATSRPNSAPP